uniref:Tc1-like transposase DDE domain-containing protein n=1 Tax=Astyanax mexicanus TaxID=7994 RepID=A0A3B1JDA5_ASTMX
MKVIFSDESRICIGQGDDAGTFVWCRSSEIYEEACLKKTTKFPQSLMIWGCMSGKGTGEMTVVNFSINAQVYIDILDSFLIPSIETDVWRIIGIIFQDDNASCHRAKTVKAFLGERHIQSMSWPANSPDLNPIEKLALTALCLLTNRGASSRRKSRLSGETANQLAKERQCGEAPPPSL